MRPDATYWFVRCCTDMCIVQMSYTSHATILTSWIVAKLSFMTRNKRHFYVFVSRSLSVHIQNSEEKNIKLN
jgi:hypothetical protein